jgi:hypothetical protein
MPFGLMLLPVFLLNGSLLWKWYFTDNTMLLVVALPAAGPNVFHGANRPRVAIAQMMNLQTEPARTPEAFTSVNPVRFGAQGSPVI